MSLLKKFKTNSFCVGGRHYSGTNKIRGFIGEPASRITSKSTKMLKGNCVKCKRNKSMTVSDATIEAEGLKDSFKVLVKQQLTLERKWLIIQ